MQTETLDATYILEAFRIVANSYRTPLKRANLMRRAMLATIDSGVKPTTYRYEFMRSKSLHLAAEVQSVINEFNTKYPGDVMTLEDVADLLSSVRNSFQAVL